MSAALRTRSSGSERARTANRTAADESRAFRRIPTYTERTDSDESPNANSSLSKGSGQAGASLQAHGRDEAHPGIMRQADKERDGCARIDSRGSPPGTRAFGNAPDPELVLLVRGFPERDGELSPLASESPADRQHVAEVAMRALVAAPREPDPSADRISPFQQIFESLLITAFPVLLPTLCPKASAPAQRIMFLVSILLGWALHPRPGVREVAAGAGVGHGSDGSGTDPIGFRSGAPTPKALRVDQGMQRLMFL